MINNDQRSIEEKIDSKIENEKTQKTIINIDQKSIEENITPAILKSDTVSTETPTSISLKNANKVIEPMDVESNMDSSTINESSDESEENDEDDIQNMLKDFIDSD